MKKTSVLVILIISAVFFTAVFAVGCAGSQHVDGDAVMTVENLVGEYAAQLIRDGAAVIFGSINLTEDRNGLVWVDIDEKEYVEDQSLSNGFYIAHKNLESTYQLSPHAFATFVSAGGSGAAAMTADDFVFATFSDHSEWGGDSPDYDDGRLYNIYVIGDMIELLLAWYMP